MEVANAPLRTTMKFEEMYVCDPTKQYYGFKSWDGRNSPSRDNYPPIN